MHSPSQIRVTLTLKPRTRDRLNKFIAEHRLANGQFISQGQAVDILLDHYARTAPPEMAQMAGSLTGAPQPA